MRKHSLLVLVLPAFFLWLILSPGVASAHQRQGRCGGANGGYGYQDAHGVTVDANGNVYATGPSWGGAATREDYATIKYDADGNRLWVARYNGPGNDWDDSHVVAVDAAGNAHITGVSCFRAEGAVCADYDSVTFKYDPQGNPLWLARYRGEGDSYDETYIVVLDAAGNVYVAGTSGTDYLTVKYDPDGNQLWAARYNGPGDADDLAPGLAVDAAGNVYITGLSAGAGSGGDFATIKYDADGNQLWVARYNGPGNAEDEARALAVDADGNVYVSGESCANATCTDSDATTIKYDAGGNQVWLARYDGPANGRDAAYDMTIDAAGNLYLTGASAAPGTGLDYITIKYDTNGGQSWAARYDGPANAADTAFDVAVDASGQASITGRSCAQADAEGGCADYDFATIKYDTDGTELWAARWTGPGGANEVVHAIAVDGPGNVYVVGNTYAGSNIYDFFLTLKYDPDGNLLWVGRYTGPEKLK